MLDGTPVMIVHACRPKHPWRVVRVQCAGSSTHGRLPFSERMPIVLRAALPYMVSLPDITTNALRSVHPVSCFIRSLLQPAAQC